MNSGFTRRDGFAGLVGVVVGGLLGVGALLALLWGNLQVNPGTIGVVEEAGVPIAYVSTGLAVNGTYVEHQWWLQGELTDDAVARKYAKPAFRGDNTPTYYLSTVYDPHDPAEVNMNLCDTDSTKTWNIKHENTCIGVRTTCKDADDRLEVWKVASNASFDLPMDVAPDATPDCVPSGAAHTRGVYTVGAHTLTQRAPMDLLRQIVFGP